VKIWQKLLTVGLALALLGGGLSLYAHLETEDLRKTAERFEAPADWTPLSAELRSYSYLCLDGGTCPQYFARWELPEVLEHGDFEALVADSELGPYLSADENCSPIYELQRSGGSSCTLRGTVDGTEVRLTYDDGFQSYTDGTSTVDPTVAYEVRVFSL